MSYAYQSQVDLAVLPNPCALGPKLNVLTGWFRYVLATHFSSAANINDALFQDRIWSPNPATTGIVIESHNRYDPELTETRPAIIIKRHPWKHIKLGIANRRMGELPGDGSELYVNWWEGSHTMFCIAGTPGEAEALGTEVFINLNELARPLMLAADLKRLEVAEIGEVGNLEEESGKNYVVPVTVAYALEEAWTIRYDLPFLKTLDLSVMGF